MIPHLYPIILMYQIKNAERVAELCQVEADTIRCWVKYFNQNGLKGLFKKKQW